MRNIKWEITGDLTSEKTAFLRKKFEKILKRQLDITVDLGDLEDIDLAGFNFLLSMHMMARRADVELVFQGADSIKLCELASKTKFDYVFRQN